MPHVDLSVPAPSQGRMSSLDRWAATVPDATEMCLVINAPKIIVAVSDSLRTLLELPDDAVGQPLLDVVHFLDFSSDVHNELNEVETAKVPPIQSIGGAALTRGLIRARCGGVPRTLDAVATPIVQGGIVVGSLTFFQSMKE